MRAEIVKSLVGPYLHRLEEPENVGYAVRLIPETVSEATLLLNVQHDHLHCYSEVLDNKYNTPDGSKASIGIHGVVDEADELKHIEVHFTKKPASRNTDARCLAHLIERHSRTADGHRILSVEELEAVILDGFEKPIKMVVRS